MHNKQSNRAVSNTKYATGDTKLIVKIALMIIGVVLVLLFRNYMKSIETSTLDEVGNQVATTVGNGLGITYSGSGTGGSNSSGVVIGGGSGGSSGNNSGTVVTVNKTTAQTVANQATALDSSKDAATITTTTIVGSDMDTLKDALVENNVLSESEAGKIDGIVVVTGDVSNIDELQIDASKYCTSGETVAIVTYDETTKEYKYIGNILKTSTITDELRNKVAADGFVPKLSEDGVKNNTPTKAKASPVSTYLTVPFSDKDEVKSLGARWDGVNKMWYVPEGTDTTAFTKWIANDKAVKSIKKIYLSVPFEDKDTVKSLGARWNQEKKSWYITNNMDTSVFRRWILS